MFKLNIKFNRHNLEHGTKKNIYEKRIFKLSNFFWNSFYKYN